MKAKKNIYLGLISLALISMMGFYTPGNKDWKVPASAKNKENPLKGNASATAKGKALFNTVCFVCHGRNGHGDGPAATTLDPQPKNLTSTEVQNQADGELYWKITNGRSPMPAYSDMYSAEQRWQLVNYIRELGK